MQNPVHIDKERARGVIGKGSMSEPFFGCMKQDVVLALPDESER